MNAKGKKTKELVIVRTKPIAGGGKSIYLEYNHDGRRDYEFLSLYLKPETRANKAENDNTMRMANAVRAMRVVEIQNGTYGFKNAVNSKMNVIQYITTIADKKRIKAGGNKRGVYQGYMALAFQLKQYRGEKITFKDIDKAYCEGFLGYLDKAKSSMHDKILDVNTRFSYMKQFEAVLNVAISDGFISANPFKQIKSENKPKKHATERFYLTAAEVKQLENTDFLYPIIKRAFLFSCYSGLRFSDVKGLTWGKLQKNDFGGTSIHYVQQKTQKQCYLPLPEIIMNYLPDRNGAADSDVVFKLPSNVTVNTQLKFWAFAAKINKKITFHVGRHTAATLLISEGVEISVIKEILGHSSIAMTEHYAKIMNKPMHDAMQKLNKSHGEG